MKLEDHPTVKWYRAHIKDQETKPPTELDADLLKKLALESGANDVGLVEIDRPALSAQREDFIRIFPDTKSIMSIICRLNPENVRSLSRSSSDLDFKEAINETDSVLRKVMWALREQGIRCMAPSSGFPMDLDLWPSKMWSVSHKPVAEEAGTGIMGNHRLHIHPRFGAFVALGTMLIDRPVTAYDKPLEYNPCIKCGLCSAVCPVGAVSKDGDFHFGNCMTHNYRDRLGGFSDWVERIVESKDTLQYRKKVSDPETVSMWQGMTYGISNKCSYCMAVCPAGEEMIGPYLEDRKAYMASVVKPLQDRADTVYVIPGSDAETHTTKRFPQKSAKQVGNGLRPRSVENFFEALPLIFQPQRAEGLNATYHFSFTGEETNNSTVNIRNSGLVVLEGHQGSADMHVTADSKTWLAFLTKEKSLLGALLGRKIRLKGSPSLMKAFARCFPS